MINVNALAFLVLLLLCIFSIVALALLESHIVRFVHLEHTFTKINLICTETKTKIKQNQIELQRKFYLRPIKLTSTTAAISTHSISVALQI